VVSNFAALVPALSVSLGVVWLPSSSGCENGVFSNVCFFQFSKVFRGGVPLVDMQLRIQFLKLVRLFGLRVLPGLVLGIVFSYYVSYF
jgi:hypothetical protein